MSDVYVIGIGMIRFNKYPDKTVRGMAAESVGLALNDAGLLKEDLQAAYVSNTFWGMFSNQHAIRGQVILRDMGIGGIPVVNCENACAGASTAFHLGYAAIRAGMHDAVLVLGSEKITHPDKGLSLTAYASCMDVENFDENLAMFEKLSKEIAEKSPGDQTPPGSKSPADQTPPGEGRSIFMDIYAMGARWHMATFGSTQRQMAAICAKNHWHGSLNPLAQYQQNMTTEEVLSDKQIAYPFTRSMCAPVGDGAAAAVLCSSSFLKKVKAARPARIIASVMGSGVDRELDGVDIGERLSRQAYDMAGLGPKDIHVAELHDATAYGELHQTEVMGFCPMGEGGVFAETGATKLGGKIPINTSGGLECRGHPIGASGLAQIHEIVCQLRGEAGKRQVENARIGLAENGGGNIGVEEATMSIHILEKVT